MKGYAILVGVDEVKTSEYGVSLELMPAKENIKLVCSELKRNGFDAGNVFKFQSKRATINNVLNKINDLSIIKEEAYLLFYFSGHGFKPKDNFEGFSAKTEFLTFYDGLLLDIELINALTKFKKNFKICIVIDSCFSGGMADEVLPDIQIQDFLFKSLGGELIIDGHKNYFSFQRSLVALKSRYEKVKVEPLKFNSETWFFASSESTKKVQIIVSNKPTGFTSLLFNSNQFFNANYSGLGEFIFSLYREENKPISKALKATSEFFKTHKLLKLSSSINIKNKITMEWNIQINRIQNQPIEITVNPDPNQFKYIQAQTFKISDTDLPSSIKSYAIAVFPNGLELEFIRVISVRGSEATNIEIENEIEPLYSIEPDSEDVVNGIVVMYHVTNRVVIGNKPIKGQVKNELGD